MHRYAAAAFLLFAACGYSEEAYLEDEATASCAFTVDCYPGLYASVDECVSLTYTGVPEAGCSFDPKAARDCVDGLEELSCPGEGEFPTFPAACDSVYLDCQAGDAE